MRAVRSFLGILLKLEAGVAVAAFVVVVAALLADVAGRELFGHGIYWAQRLASYCTTAAGMLGLCLVVQSGGHLRPKAIEKTVPESWGPVMNRIADSVSALICLFMAYYGAEYVAASAKIGQRGMSIEIIVWPIQIIIPYVFASGAVRYIAFAVFPELRPVDSELQK